MPTNGDTFADHILSQMGIAPSPDAHTFIANAINRAMRIDYDKTGRPVISLQNEYGTLTTADQDGNVSDMGVEEFVRDLVKDNGHLFPSATPASMIGNPFRKESWNATRQMELWRDNPQLAEHLEIEALTGAPAPRTQDPKSTINPWRKETWNLTEQYRLENSQPDLARRLMAEAGSQ